MGKYGPLHFKFAITNGKQSRVSFRSVKIIKQDMMRIHSV